VLWIPIEARRPPRLIPPQRAPRTGSWRARFHKTLAAAFRVGVQPETMRLA